MKHHFHYLAKKQLSKKSLNEILIANLQQLMKEYSLTEAELARQAKVPQPTVHKVLTGKTDDPRISTIQALATFFETSIDKLYSSTKEVHDQNKPVLTTQSVPIVSWSDCLKGKEFIENLHANNWNQWLVTENLSQHLYGVRTKPSMAPRFTQNSVLIVDPHAIPVDGDIIVVHYSETLEATLRKIVIDGPRKILTLVNEKNESFQEPLKDEIRILGVVIQVRLDL